MKYDFLQARTRRAAVRPMTRRALLQRSGALLGLATVPGFLAACGGGGNKPPATQNTVAQATQSQSAAAPTVAPPTVAAPTVVAPTAAAAAASAAIPPGPLTVKASEANGYPIFSIDKLAVAAGPLAVNFVVAGNMKHELWVYPLQDVSTLMNKKRAGESASEPDYLKQLVAQTGEVDVGLTKAVQGTVTPGFYELSCFIKGANPDGTSYRHFDVGQALTVAVVGPGGPSASVLTPGNTITVDMVPGTEALKDSWLFIPDRLTAKAGDVTFKANNKMDVAHDLVVYPLGNISQFITSRFAGQEDYTMIKGQQVFEDLDAGKSGEKVAKLTPGWWAAACFMVGKNPDGTSFLHRDKGQRFTFLVQ